MANSQIIDYIKKQLKNDMSMDLVRANLLTSGSWNLEEIEEALASNEVQRASRKKGRGVFKFAIILIIIAIAALFFYPKPYTSSPGFVTAESILEFEANKPVCYGYSRLTNAMEVAADAPGKSLCFGWLQK